MARTKQTARKSTGGKHPRKRLSRNRSKTITIVDHTGNNVTIPGGSSRVGLGFFPFQVYILASAASLSTNSEFPHKLRSYIVSNNACVRFNENCHWRLEVFSLPQVSVMDCINHHEQEKQHRKSVGKGPIMLNRKELLVVDGVDWETKGLLSVEYTAQFLGRDGSEREFENHVNDYPSWRDDAEELALPQLRTDLTVYRYPHVDQLTEGFLQTVWDDEGHEWALSSLMERNVALGWPDDPDLLDSNILPDKPVAKQITRGYLRSEKRPRISEEDDDDDDNCDQFTNYLESEDIVTYGERCDPHTAVPKSIAQSRKQPASPVHMSLPKNLTASLVSHEVVDSVGRKCVGFTHAMQASFKAHFSYSLYVIGQRLESPQTFFALLNQRFLSFVPWRLHVYAVPDLSTALSHHDDEMATRPVSGRLPTSYTGLPEQPQSHIFLFIDEHMNLREGPKVATSDAAMEGPVLQVIHAGGWNRVAQMLLTYFILCTETPKIMAPLAALYYPPPSISASVSLTPKHPGTGPCRVPNEMHLNLTFTLNTAVDRSVTVHTHDTILTSNDYLWDSFLVVVDAETNEEIVLPPPKFYPDTSHILSVEQLQALSFPWSATSPARHQVLTLRPGKEIVRSVIFKSSRLFQRYQDVLVEGKSYKIALRSGQAIKKWIWGDLDEDTRGPFGVSAISILEREDPTDHFTTLEMGKAALFTFDEPIDTATSFPDPSCHISI